MDRGAFLDKALEHYAGCYDISRVENSETGLAAVCEYHEHGVGYALVRKAEMWSADRHEYVWFYSVPQLTPAVYEACYAEAFKAGMERVVPKEGHMSSAVVVVFVCDEADDAAKKKVRQCRYRKDFKFGLHGWVAVRAAAAVLKEDRIIANGEGRGERKFLDSILHPRKRKARVGLFGRLFGRRS